MEDINVLKDEQEELDEHTVMATKESIARKLKRLTWGYGFSESPQVSR